MPSLQIFLLLVNLLVNALVNEATACLVCQPVTRTRASRVHVPLTTTTSHGPLTASHGVLFSRTPPTDADDTSSSDDDDTVDNVGSTLMIASIGFYKDWISPILPPACRFVPTCSQYGVQAIKEFGPTKGLVLTTWRIMRCTPLGGKGYDPPKWPPVPYTYSSY